MLLLWNTSGSPWLFWARSNLCRSLVQYQASVGTCFRELCWIYWNCCRQSARVHTSVKKRWRRAFGIRSNCNCPIMDYIENIVTCVEISQNLVSNEMCNRRFSAFFPCALSCCRKTTQVGVDLNRYMSSTMSCLRDRTQNCGDLRVFYSKTSYL